MPLPGRWARAAAVVLNDRLEIQIAGQIHQEADGRPEAAAIQQCAQGLVVVGGSRR